MSLYPPRESPSPITMTGPAGDISDEKSVRIEAVCQMEKEEEE